MTNFSRAPGGRAGALRTTLLLLVHSVVPAGCGAVADDPKPLEREAVVPPGDCHCADGSQFNFWERKADTSRVVLFLNGGGVCWDAEMCAFENTEGSGEAFYYDWNLSSTNPENRRGMFDTTRADNPFADHSYLYVSSCTCDAHLGDSTEEYSEGLTVEHRGYANGTAALDYLAENYPDADVTVLGGQSGSWPDYPDFNADVLDARWGAYDAVPDWAVDGLTVPEWGVPRFWVQAGLHDPDLVLARFDYAYDPKATVELTEWLGDPPDLLAELDRKEASIEAAGVDLRSYTAPGADHHPFEPEKFYEIKVEGVRFVDWIEQLTTDDPPGDVHCVECGPSAEVPIARSVIAAAGRPARRASGCASR